MNSKLKVLAIDHSKLFRSLIESALTQHDFSTVFCSTGQEALHHLKTQQFDLVCAAYHLVDMTGEAFCEKLRKTLNYQNTRVILFTSEDNQELLKRALLAGATDIYSKDRFDLFETYLKRLASDALKSIIGQVLLIEDSPSQLLWVESLLLEYGLEVDSFSNAEDAIIAFNQKSYDLVISDIVLEGNMSGLSLVREIRRNPTEKGLIPIFAMSAYNDISRRIELYHVGINDYMPKPIIAEEFIYRVNNLIQNYRIVNQLSAEREHLQKLALLDPVTKLYNRNAFNKFAPKEIAQAERNQQAISLAVLDIDFFKKVNDTYGHKRGDNVLEDVGLWLTNTLRKGDMVFRWGGEEFVIILPHCNASNAREVLEKQRIRFNKRKYAGLSITISIGISSINDVTKQKDLKQLFSEADKAVYKAKELGRNRVCLF